MASNLEYHVRQAKDGNKRALETVIESIQDKIYGLALRMLGNDEDAEDESQEILIKVITHLSEFREESAFSGLVNENNACRCHRQAGKKRTLRSESPSTRKIVKGDGVAKGRAEAVAQLKDLCEFDRAAAMFRRYPEYRSPESFTYIVKDLIRSGKYAMFREMVP
jgi:RNA polymerase sigma factor (sigma-70 family)